MNKYNNTNNGTNNNQSSINSNSKNEEYSLNDAKALMKKYVFENNVDNGSQLITSLANDSYLTNAAISNTESSGIIICQKLKAEEEENRSDKESLL